MMIREATVFSILCFAFHVNSFTTSSMPKTHSSRENWLLLHATSNENGDFFDSETNEISRRSVLSVLGSSVLATGISLGLPSKADAYQTNFPDELEATDAGDQDSRQRRVNNIRQQEAAVALSPEVKPFSAAVWGSALWLLSGSRSNPLINPIANALYDAEKEQWLQDRNEGLFASPPIGFFAVLFVIFFALGSVTDMVAIFLADGNRNTSLELAGVSLIGGASLELGRIASGEKAATRDESDRSAELKDEFEQFANERLRPGGNCHRTDVVRAFRRYFAKYRQADIEGYALSDLEIEQLLRTWSRARGLGMSSAGFYSGIQINTDADVFTSR